MYYQRGHFLLLINMFIFIQFPFSDCRSFVGDETYRLPSPTWPSPESGRDFIRGSGIIKDRFRGGLKSWPGEEVYCDAKKSLRFNPLMDKKPIGKWRSDITLTCSFRRFYFDGMCVARMELGMKVRISKKQPLFKNDCFKLIGACLSTPVYIPSVHTSSIPYELINCDRSLAKHFLKSTTKTESVSKTIPIENWWITPGLPILLIEDSYPYKISDFPKHTILVKQEPEIKGDLYHSRIERSGKRFNVWFLRYHKGKDDLENVRRIRMHLFRLHAERECMKQILRLIVKKKISPKAFSNASNRLQKYLLDSMRLLNKKARYGISQTNILKTVQRFDEIVNPGERISLLTQIEENLNIRKNVFNNLEKFIVPSEDTNGLFHIIGNNNQVFVGKEQKVRGNVMSEYKIQIGDNAKFSGDFIVAESIQNSFNKISSSDTSQEIKKKLTELSNSVLELCNHLSNDEAKEVVRDMDSLIDEAISDKPRRKWYELSAEGLIDAAKSVGTVGKPVIDTTKAILQLLEQ